MEKTVTDVTHKIGASQEKVEDSRYVVLVKAFAVEQSQ